MEIFIINQWRSSYRTLGLQVTLYTDNVQWKWNLNYGWKYNTNQQSGPSGHKPHFVTTMCDESYIWITSQRQQIGPQGYKSVSIFHHGCWGLWLLSVGAFHHEWWDLLLAISGDSSSWVRKIIVTYQSAQLNIMVEILLNVVISKGARASARLLELPYTIAITIQGKDIYIPPHRKRQSDMCIFISPVEPECFNTCTSRNEDDDSKHSDA